MQQSSQQPLFLFQSRFRKTLTCTAIVTALLGLTLLGLGFWLSIRYPNLSPYQNTHEWHMGNFSIQINPAYYQGNNNGQSLFWQDHFITSDSVAQVINSYQSKGLGKYLSNTGYTTTIDLALLKIENTYAILIQAEPEGTWVNTLTRMEFCPG